MWLLWLKPGSLLTPVIFFRQTFNGFPKKKLLRVLSTLRLLLCSSTVLIHPVESLEGALRDDSLLDLNKFEVFYLFFFFELLNSLGVPMLLFFFLGLREPDLLDVREGGRVPGLF